MSEIAQLRLNAQLGGSAVEVRERDGKKYLVAPIVAVREKVLNGQLLPADEIAKSVAAWDGISITIHHPPADLPFSEQEEWTVKNQVGFLDNMSVGAGNKLVGEAWLNLPAPTPAAKEIHVRVQRGDVLNVSTGYLARTEQREGKHDGEVFNGVQHGLIPLHLALLPDQDGACSIQDGCGMPRMNLFGDLDDRQRLVARSIFSEFGTADEPWPIIEHIAVDFAVFQQGEDLFRVSYRISDRNGTQSVKLGEPEKVRLIFQPISNQEGGLLGRLAKFFLPGGQMNEKQKAIDSLKGRHALSDCETKALGDLDEALLVKLNAEQDREQKPEEIEAKDNAAEKAKPATAEKTTQVTPEALLGTERLAALDRIIANEGADRRALIEQVKNENRYEFSEEEIGSMSTSALRKLVENKSRPKVPNYTGAASGAAVNKDSLKAQFAGAYPGDISRAN